MVLAALGVWGEVADGATLLEDPTDLVEDVVDDLFVRHALRSAVPPFRRKVALEMAFRAVDNPGTPLDPEPDMQDPTPTGPAHGAWPRACAGRSRSACSTPIS